VLHDVLFISAPPERGPELDHALDDLIGVFQRLLADGVAAGAYDVDDIGTTAVLLVNTLHGVFNPIWLGASPSTRTGSPPPPAPLPPHRQLQALTAVQRAGAQGAGRGGLTACVSRAPATSTTSAGATGTRRCGGPIPA
jgi:hypothetical protein